MMHFPPTKFEAILDLVGNDKEFSVTSKGEFIWKEDNDDGKPSESEIQTRLIELQAEYDSQEYARKRQAEYPSIAELTVALYDTDDKSAVEAKRAAIKKKYPKP